MGSAEPDRLPIPSAYHHSRSSAEVDCSSSCCISTTDPTPQLPGRSSSSSLPLAIHQYTQLQDHERPLKPSEFAAMYRSLPRPAPFRMYAHGSRSCSQNPIPYCDSRMLSRPDPAYMPAGPPGSMHPGSLYRDDAAFSSLFPYSSFPPPTMQISAASYSYSSRFQSPKTLTGFARPLHSDCSSLRPTESSGSSFGHDEFSFSVRPRRFTSSEQSENDLRKLVVSDPPEMMFASVYRRSRFSSHEEEVTATVKKKRKRSAALEELKYIGKLTADGKVYENVRVWEDHWGKKFYDCTCGRRKAIQDLKKIKMHAEKH